MSQSPSQAATLPPGRHLLLYDGVCGFCSRVLRFVIARDGRRVFNFAALQSPRGRAAIENSGGTPDDLTTFYVVENYRMQDARVVAKSRAALFVAGALGWPWKAACLLSVLPTAWLDRAYDVVADNRYRIFGRYDVCQTPRPKDRDRFVD